MSSQIYYETYNVTGVVNSTVQSSKFTAPENEKRYIVGIYMIVSAVNGNTVTWNLDREELANIDDNLIGTVAGQDHCFWELQTDLPVGQSLSLSLTCGGTAENLKAVIAYRII